MTRLVRCALLALAFAAWPPAAAGADRKPSAAAAIREALKSLPAQPAPTDDQIKEFRGGLETYFNGNLPALVAYLGRLEPLSADNPSPSPAGSWTPQPEYDDDGNVVVTAEEKRNQWRRRAEAQLRALAVR